MGSLFNKYGNWPFNDISEFRWFIVFPSCATECYEIISPFSQFSEHIQTRILTSLATRFDSLIPNSLLHVLTNPVAKKRALKQVDTPV